MKRFIMTLYARSRPLGLDQIARLLGATPDGGHRRGDLDERGDRSDLETSWWVGSGAGDDATLEEHAEALVGRLAPLGAEVVAHVEAGDLDLLVGVGIMYDTYTTSARLPRGLVALAARIGAGIEVSSYPTEFS